MNGMANGLPRGEPSGADTFARYRYQAKLTLIHWLGTLTPTGPTVVYAEHIEDVLLEYADRLTFVQIKTRAAAAGTWTAEAMCSEGGGIDSLVRAYVVARDRPCSFELHLEGSTSSSQATVDFVRQCTLAGPVLRTKIRSLLDAALQRDATDEDLEDFLSRLKVVPRQPSQQDIDSKCIRILGELAASLTMAEVEQLFHQLLQMVESAQDATGSSPNDSDDGITFLGSQLTHLLSPEPSQEQVVACKRLSRERVAGLLPGTLQAAALLLIERSTTGRPPTALEEKLIAAGANNSVIQRARQLRAMSEGRRLELLAGPLSRSNQLEDVSNRVLLHAEARAQLCKTQGESADDLFARLVSEQAIEDADQASLFNRDRPALVGLLCCLSDECKFAWRAP